MVNCPPKSMFHSRVPPWSLRRTHHSCWKWWTRRLRAERCGHGDSRAIPNVAIHGYTRWETMGNYGKIWEHVRWFVHVLPYFPKSNSNFRGLVRVSASYFWAKDDKISCSPCAVGKNCQQPQMKCRWCCHSAENDGNGKNPSSRIGWIFPLNHEPWSSWRSKTIKISLLDYHKWI